MAKTNMIKITLVKSPIACLKNQKATVEALGLHKIGQFKVVEDTPVYRGMIKVVDFLVKVENVD